MKINGYLIMKINGYYYEESLLSRYRLEVKCTLCKRHFEKS